MKKVREKKEIMKENVIKFIKNNLTKKKKKNELNIKNNLT